jgi:uroporphyrinogen-III decarboxylase
MFSLTGSFNRLEAFMGTCEAMIAMYEEPDEVNALFTAYTDFRLKIIDKYAEYYKPDIYVNGDDVATSTGLFFAPEVYRKLIWPHEKRLAQAAIAKGMIVEHHVCGKVDEIIPDIIATGASVWQTAQHMNDLGGISEKYGDQLCIHGGWDSYGACSMADASEEDIRAEVRRCIDTYGEWGNYMLFPIIFGDPADPRTALRRSWCSDECRKYKASL